ncbi:Hercynine oxygenase [Streptomyces tanashiensis]
MEDGELTAQHWPLMSPLVWDLAHIGNQEESGCGGPSRGATRCGPRSPDVTLSPLKEPSA